MNSRLDAEDILRRLMLIARGLGFVFLVYFIPVALRDVIALAIGRGDFIDALTNESSAPWIALSLSLGTLALSVAFVKIHDATARGRSASPPRLLPFDARAGAEWIRGLFFGGALATMAVLPLLVAGVVRIEGSRPDFLDRLPAALALALLLVFEAAREEMGFRGPPLRDLSSATRFVPSATFLAGSFAVIHVANPSATRMGLVGIFVAGVALAGIVRARGDLWMACGVHAGWNVFLGLIWSLPLSGHSVAHSALEISMEPAPWAGVAFGPEGGVTGLAAFCLLGIVAWKRPPAGPARGS